MSIRESCKCKHYVALIQWSRSISIYQKRHLKKFVTRIGRGDAVTLQQLLKERATVRQTDRSNSVPSGLQLRRVMIQETLPFIGFGFLDNAIMIIAGEYIEITIGATLGISTMAAAALGNWISDLSGLSLGSKVEMLCLRFGLPTANITSEQSNHPLLKRAVFIGRVVGISVGCILGMFPLLWFH